tara:strand:- start:1801 stop:2019 length:219 start_codon:yes stop_codon:yes gene_type:complete
MEKQVKSISQTVMAFRYVYGHYDLAFLKLLDASQLEDLFIQDAFNDPHTHLTFGLDKDKINFEIIKQELTST